MAIKLSQYRDYYTPIVVGKKSTLLEKTTYGGKDSESIPCGFNTEWIIKRNVTRSRKDKDMRNCMNKIAKKANIEKANTGSLQTIPNG